jgi:hypothetical protein
MRQHQLGTSGLTILRKIETGALLTLSGKPTRAAQYTIGNPLLAIQMIEHQRCKFCDETGEILPSSLLRNGFGSNEKTDQMRR